MAHKREQLAKRRRDMGYSQETLAARIGVDRSQIIRWERGPQRPQPQPFARLAAALRLSPAELDVLLREGGTEATSVVSPSARTIASAYAQSRDADLETPEDDDVRRRALLTNAALAIGALTAPSIDWLHRILGGASKGAIRIGVSDIARIRSIVELHKSLDYQYGGGLVYESLETFSAAVSKVVRQRCDDRLRPNLLVAVGELRVLTGWTAFDACRHGDAQRHFQAAERLAVAADSASFATFVRYCQARQLQHQRHNLDALEVLQLAQDHLGDSGTPAAASMLSATIAPSLAALGDHGAAVKSLDDAQRSFEAIDPVVEPTWLGWLDEAELWAQYGRVYRDAARRDRSFGERAVEWTSRALGGFGHEMARSSALNQIGLCSALFLAGEPDAALQIGSRLPAEAGNLTSKRIGERIRNLQRDTAGYRHHSDVGQFNNEVGSL